MNNEEMQNTIQFILDQQAQLTINLDKLGEKVDKLGDNVNKIADAQAAYERRTSRLEESFQVLVQVAANMDGRLDTLSINTDKRFDALERRTGRLEESFQMLVQLAKNYERRTSRLEESFQVLVQLAANMDGRLDTLSADTDRRMEALSANTDRRIEALTAAQELTNQQLAETDKQLAQTDSKLNALIDTVDRYISNGRNGRS
jgi:chromosome segregation ATPase